MAHVRKAVIMLIVFCVYFALFGLIFGWHRLRVDFWPLDQSVDGPNVYASFIWLPIAFLGGWIGSEIRGARNLEKQKELFDLHAQHIDEKLHEHQLSVAKLLGISNKATADALNATPGDRQLDTESWSAAGLEPCSGVQSAAATARPNSSWNRSTIMSRPFTSEMTSAPTISSCPGNWPAAPWGPMGIAMPVPIG